MQGTMSCARRSIATSSALSNCWVLQPKGLHRPTVPVSTLHQACCQELGAASQLISGQCRRVSRHHVPCLAQNAVEAQPKTQQAELPSCWNRVPFEQQQGWLKAAAELQGLGIPAEQAHQVLVKAFGWGSQGYWRHSKVDEPPTADQIRAVAAYLASLNIQVGHVTCLGELNWQQKKPSSCLHRGRAAPTAGPDDNGA
jgi:hypothetical protein